MAAAGFQHLTCSGLPLNPMSVPFRVYRFCEADMDAERREDVLPSTSNRASSICQPAAKNSFAVEPHQLLSLLSHFAHPGSAAVLSRMESR